MSDPDTRRASGETQAEEITHEQAALLEAEVEIEHSLPNLPEELRPNFRTPGFSRMKTEWSGPEGQLVRDVMGTIDDRIKHQFIDAYMVMNDLFELIRTPEEKEDGTPLTDQFGFAVWKRLPSGDWDEDWSRLTRSQKEDFLFKITTRLFRWEQMAADSWTEAMLAKAQWEERFSIAYSAPPKGTIEDRTSAAKSDSADERYWAVFAASYSRRADAVVRVMSLLGQRLKDSLVS
jgi:hypothetical protein